MKVCRQCQLGKKYRRPGDVPQPMLECHTAIREGLPLPCEGPGFDMVKKEETITTRELGNIMGIDSISKIREAAAKEGIPLVKYPRGRIRRHDHDGNVTEELPAWIIGYCKESAKGWGDRRARSPQEEEAPSPTRSTLENSPAGQPGPE